MDLKIRKMKVKKKDGKTLTFNGVWKIDNHRFYDGFTIIVYSLNKSGEISAISIDECNIKTIKIKP